MKIVEKEVFLNSLVADLDVSRQLVSHLRRSNIFYIKDITKDFIEKKKDKKFMNELRMIFQAQNLNIDDV